jgi:hypothetical protein
MATVKTLLAVSVAGVIVGAVVATLIAPGILAWYSTPAMGQALCNCQEIAKSTATQLVRAQLIGAAVGGVVFLIVGIVVRSTRKKAPPAPPVASTAA